VHAILKPILAAGVSVTDYDIQYLLKRGQAAQEKQARPEMDQEYQARQTKAHQWSQEHHTLGATPKTNVTRPRAILAPLEVTATSNNTTTNAMLEHKQQRAQLWKARIYTDQAYQAWQDVVEAWRSTTPGQMPTHMQGPLTKLLKCLGLSRVSAETYALDESILQVVLKLPKGRILLARVLEQALLPPSAVPVLLVPTLHTLMQHPLDGVPPAAPPSSSSFHVAATATPHARVDERVWVAWARVVASRIGWPPDVLLHALQALNAPTTAVNASARLPCAHALLQRGSDLLQQQSGGSSTPDNDESKDAGVDEEWIAQWHQAESEFMKQWTGSE
jgi:hypothetical protein